MVADELSTYHLAGSVTQGLLAPGEEREASRRDDEESCGPSPLDYSRPKNFISDQEYFSDVGFYVHHRKEQRAAKKRADIQANARFKRDRIQPSGEVWAACIAAEIQLPLLQTAARRRVLSSAKLELRFDQFFSDVFFGHVDVRQYENQAPTMSAEEEQDKSRKHSLVFLFKFGAIVAWDLPLDLQPDLLALIEPFEKDPLKQSEVDEDRVSYVWSFKKAIEQDIIHLTSTQPFERLAYSYALAQSCKLSIFEVKVDETIDRTRAIPENLAKTGTINARRDEISKRIGELFLSRFYINLQTDILDTPDVFWEFDEYADFYTSCRAYLEIPKRVDLLNQRLDIMKDLYDMLNQELSLQHGYKLEWIVIYLIIMEVAIEVIWNIIIRDVLKLV